jgi:carboxyl-terminal processing protease
VLRCEKLLVMVALGCLAAGTAPAEDKPDTFDWVTQTVDEKFYDKKFAGVDWPAIKTKYRQRAVRAASREARAAIINQMLAELRTSHTAFYTPDTPEYFQLLGLFLPRNDWLGTKTAKVLTDGKALYPGIGIFTVVVKGEHFVSGVFDGLPAQHGGLLVGDKLVTVDDAPFHPMASFQGKAGKPVAIVIERSAGKRQTLTVTPTMLDGSTMFVDAMKASAKLIDQGGHKIAYIHAWSYAGDQYQDILERQLLFGDFKDAAALVLDVRQGLGGASPSNLNIFTQRCLTWTSRSRNGEQASFPSCWAKPVVLLTDHGSRSGKELLAYSFKRNRIGRIVGTRTGGAVLAGTIFANEADASLLYLATNDIVLDDGTRLEGKGVEPDITVPFKIEFAQGADPQRERALTEAARMVTGTSSSKLEAAH